MIVSNCCGAEFHDLATKICVCCNEHADEIEQERPSIEVVEIEEYNHTVYRNGVVAAMVEKYGSFANAIFEMEARIASLEVTIKGMRECDEEDWSKECGKLYDFLCEYMPEGKLLDEYHKWSKKK
jgi:hypothetical protein